MSMLGMFVLTTAISISSSRNPASEKVDAYKALAKATYIQTDVDKQVKKLEKKFVPNYMKEYGGWITLIAKTTVQQKISYEWTF